MKRAPIQAIILAFGSSVLAAQTPPQATPAIRTELDKVEKMQVGTRSAALQQVLTDARKANDRYGEAEAMLNIGIELEHDDHVDEATQVLQMAATQYEGLSAKDEAAICLNAIGQNEIALSKPILAETAFLKALKLEKAADNEDAAADTNRLLGKLYMQTGKFKDAAECFQSALPRVQAGKDEAAKATILAALGDANERQGNASPALDFYSQSLAISTKLGDKKAQSSTLSNRGNAYAGLGDSDKALEDYRAALRIETDQNDTNGQAASLASMGSLLSDEGRKQEALDCLTRALALNTQANNRPGIADDLLDIGEAYDDLGDKPKALEYYGQSLGLYINLHDVSGQISAYNNMATTYCDQKQYAKSLDLLQKSLDLSKADGNKELQMHVLINMAANYTALGQPDNSTNVLKGALSLARDLGQQRAEAVALNDLAVAEAKLGSYDQALSDLADALSIQSSVRDAAGIAQTYDNMGTISQELQVPALAILFDKQAVNEYQELRADIKGLPKEERDSYAKSVAPTYRALSDLLIKQGRLAEAEHVLDLLKREENFEFVSGDVKRSGAVEEKVEQLGTEQGWWNRYQKLQDRSLAILKQDSELRQQNARALRDGSQLPADQQQKLVQLESERQDLERETKAYFDEVKTEVAGLGDQIRQESQERMDSVQTEVLRTLKDLHANGTDVVAVYAVAAPTELHYILITPSGTTHVDVEVGSDKLNQLIAEYRNLLINPASDPKPKGKELYDLLFAKAFEQLDQYGAKRVMWCLDGSLRYIPLAAIWDGKEYLIEREDFTMFDPLHMSVIASSNRAKPEMAGFAATNGKLPKYPPLPGADAELKAVVDQPTKGFSGAVPGNAWEDSQFTGQMLQSALTDEDYSMLHMATHFDIGKDFESSYLLLGDGQELSLKQFMDWSSGQELGHVDLLCLSACNTAETLVDPARQAGQLDSFVSLTLGAGAKAVIATLWPVSDESTPLLMQRFYENWVQHQEQGKAQALRNAQLALLDGQIKRGSSAAANRSPSLPATATPSADFSHPYYWAPFLLFGNWK